MGREENVAVFEDTKRRCKQDPGLHEATKRAIEGQKVILETDPLPQITYERFAEPAQIIVSKKRSYQAAAAYLGWKTAVHNFASAGNPGGGVSRGASAQEEALCRCSNLYACLNAKEAWNRFYQPHREKKDPLHNDDIIYTPGVTVFKTDAALPEELQREEWYQVDVISCAAPNLRDKPSNAYNSGDGEKSVRLTDRELLELHKKRLRRILDVAVLQGAEIVILGAFGCGAFQNRAEIVARAAKEVLADYRHAFRTVEFAVYCTPKDEWNYKAFQRVVK